MRPATGGHRLEWRGDMNDVNGSLIIIGGHEHKETQGDRIILKEVARRAIDGKGRLVIITLATTLPEEVGAEYRAVFEDLDVPHVDVVPLRTRRDGHDDAVIAQLDAADVIFFSGGDQLRITSKLGGTPAFHCIQEIYHRGATIAGTSAGAAAMPNTMIVAGPSDSSFEEAAISMAPGLGFMPGVVIDSHFAERGRMGRLLGAVAQNPENIGFGIDENTAIVVDPGQPLRVLGTGAVYVVDGRDIVDSRVHDEQMGTALGIFNVRLHVLAQGDGFDLQDCRPIPGGDVHEG